MGRRDYSQTCWQRVHHPTGGYEWGPHYTSYIQLLLLPCKAHLLSWLQAFSPASSIMPGRCVVVRPHNSSTNNGFIACSMNGYHRSRRSNPRGRYQKQVTHAAHTHARTHGSEWRRRGVEGEQPQAGRGVGTRGGVSGYIYTAGCGCKAAVAVAAAAAAAAIIGSL